LSEIHKARRSLNETQRGHGDRNFADGSNQERLGALLAQLAQICAQSLAERRNLEDADECGTGKAS
jgi:hypothetical protein